MDQPTFAPAARRAATAATAAPSKALGLQPQAAGSAGLDWGLREDIADQIGHFIARSIAGRYRGQSGRDRNPLPSRIWVVVRDYAGQIYSQVTAGLNWPSVIEQ